MVTRLSIIAAFAVASVCVVSLLHADSKAGPQIGAAAPAFSLTDQTGKTVSLSDYAGKTVVLEWFNNECPFVVKHYDSHNMNNLASKYAEKGVVWLAINSTSGKTTADNEKAASAWNMNRPVLDDSSGKVGHEYHATNTPTMYIIDKNGNLAYWGAIDDQPNPNPASIDGATNYVSKALDELLANKSVSETRTKPYGCSVKYAS